VKSRMLKPLAKALIILMLFAVTAGMARLYAAGVMSDSSTDLTNNENALTTGNTVLSYYLQTVKGKGPWWLKTTDIQLSLIQDDSPVYSLETIQPLGGVNRNGSLWFWQGRYANQGDDNNTANLGLGWRKLSDDHKSLIGFNTFYDYGFQYNLARVGLGAEYFNRQAEYRFNWYLPVSGDRLTGVGYLDSGILYSYIRAVEGCDFELGTALPDAPWWKVYAGGYYWDNKYNSDEAGYRLRSAMQLTPRVALELGYARSNLTSDAYGKVTYNIADILGSSFWGTPIVGANGEIVGYSVQIYKDGKPYGEPIVIDDGNIHSHFTLKATPITKGDKRLAETVQPDGDISCKLLQKVERENNIKTESFTKLASYTGLVKVTVTDGTNAITGASVSVTIGGTIFTKTTDATGIASFSNLPTGTYTFTASATDCTSNSTAIAVTDDGGSGSIVLTNSTTVTLIVNCSSTGGTVTPSAGTHTYNYNDTVTLSATPVTNYGISLVIENGVPVTHSTSSYSKTITHITSNQTLYVAFTGTYTLTLVNSGFYSLHVYIDDTDKGALSNGDTGTYGVMAGVTVRVVGYILNGSIAKSDTFTMPASDTSYTY